MTSGESVAIAAILRPIVILVLMVLVIIPITMLAQRYLPDSRFKSFLLKRRGTEDSLPESKSEQNYKVLFIFVLYGSLIAFIIYMLESGS